MTNPICNICANLISEPFYNSGQSGSLTSLNRIVEVSTIVRYCSSCRHIQTDPTFDTSAYYDTDYDILIESEEDDQIYKVIEGKPVFRTDHQVEVLLEKLTLKNGSRLLDYGCAKSSTFRNLLKKRPDLDLNLFDVSERYVPFWSSFLIKDKWATYTPPSAWDSSFDVITSFFAFEHIEKPGEALRDLSRLLKKGGVFYCVVPNILTNIADLVVVDHLNHFTKDSLLKMCSDAGLTQIDVDSEIHTSALVITATKNSDLDYSARLEEEDVQAKLVNMSKFWSSALERTRQFESSLDASSEIAIYGAGFYAAFITAALSEPARIKYYIDQNPHLEGRKMNEKPIIHPKNFGSDVQSLFVGLNPDHARDIIKPLETLQGLKTFFL